MKKTLPDEDDVAALGFRVLFISLGCKIGLKYCNGLVILLDYLFFFILSFGLLMGTLG